VKRCIFDKALDLTDPNNEKRVARITRLEKRMANVHRQLIDNIRETRRDRLR